MGSGAGTNTGTGSGITGGSGTGTGTGVGGGMSFYPGTTSINIPLKSLDLFDAPDLLPNAFINSLPSFKERGQA